MREIGHRLDIGAVIHLAGEDDQWIGKWRMQFFEGCSRVVKAGVDAIADCVDIASATAGAEQRGFGFADKEAGVGPGCDLRFIAGELFAFTLMDPAH